MNLFDTADWAFWLFAVLVLIPAIEELARGKIGNLATGALLLGGIVVALVSGIETVMWQNLAGLVGLFALGFALFAAGLMGGGIVKLFAATAFWFRLGDLPEFLLYTPIVAGVMAVIRIAVSGRGLKKPEGKFKGTPFAPAVAIGALVVAGGLFSL